MSITSSTSFCPSLTTKFINFSSYKSTMDTRLTKQPRVSEEPKKVSIGNPNLGSSLPAIKNTVETGTDYSMPPDSIESDFKYNSVEFYLWDRDILRKVDPASLRKTVIYPECADQGLKKLLMKTDGGGLIPATLPQLSDIGQLEESLLVEIIVAMDELSKSDSTSLLPNKWAHIFDPKPVLPRTIDNFLLSHKGCSIDVRSSCNAARLYTVVEEAKQISVRVVLRKTIKPKIRTTHLEMRPMRRFWVNPITQRMVDSWNPKDAVYTVEMMKDGVVKTDTRIAYWNARGIGRNSFRDNMAQLLQACTPAVVVLSETRVTSSAAQTILAHLPFDKMLLFEPYGFTGGFAVLWNSSLVSFQNMSKNPSVINGIIEAPKSDGCGSSNA